MRIILKTTPNQQPVPVDYQQKLVGTIHKWIGDNNELHGGLSLFSFSWLQGSKLDHKLLSFRQGADFFISFYDANVIKSIVRNILYDPIMFCGMEVTDVQIEATPDLSQRTLFYCASPVFIKRRLQNGKTKQYSYDDSESSALLCETLTNKMRKAGLPMDETLNISFDISYPHKHMKLIKYHGIGNKANICPINIIGRPETKVFAWDVGVGNSTDIGFGSIY